MQNRPAAKVLGLFVLGLVGGRYFDLPVPLLLLLACLTLVAGFTIWYADKGNPRLKEFCIAVALALLGFIQYELATRYLPANHISHFTNHRDAIGIRGIVSKYPEPSVDKLALTVATQEAFAGGRLFSCQGNILVNVRVPEAQLRYGDEILLRTKLRRPRDRRNPGEFDYRAFLLAQGIYGTASVNQLDEIEILSTENGTWLLRKAVFPVKAYLEDYLAENLPPEVSALLQGLMIGLRSEIASEVREAFAKVGAIHLLAVSGLHVGFIMLIFIGLLGLFRFPYVARVALTILGLIFYAYLTNLKPPVIRASIMGGLVLGGTLLGRKTDIYNTLAIAALFILIINPLELFQSGFQLSFSAVLSIVYLFPKFKRVVSRNSHLKRMQRLTIVRYPSDLFLVSAAAFIGTLPFTLYYFDRLPNIALLANLACVPLAFFGLANGMVAAGLSLILPSVAQLYLSTASLSLQALIALVEWASQVPLAFLEVYNFPALAGLIYFAAVWLILNLQNAFARKGLLLLVLFAANLLLWRAIVTDDRSLQVAYLDVGQGDAALIAFPDGRHALIDGGPRSVNSDAGAWVVAPFLRRQGIEKLDALILSHADADHLGGLPHILRNFQVEEVWDNGQRKETGLYQEYRRLIDSLGVVHRVLQAGDRVRAFGAVEILVAHPTQAFLEHNSSDVNDGSLSLKVSYGDTDFLFLGDVEEQGEAMMSQLGGLLNSEVLKVAHHGSRTSSTSALIAAVEPQWAVISVGQLNKFGHPAPTVLSRFFESGSKILRTDREGAIILKSNGERVRRVSWR